MKYDDWLERETYLVIDQHCKDGKLKTPSVLPITATIGIESYEKRIRRPITNSEMHIV